MGRVGLLLALFAITGPASAVDLSKVERKIAKEPAYKTKSPRYALLVIGPEARDFVWLVHDGGDLHVLADKPVKLPPNKRGSAENGYEYELSDLTANGRAIENLRVGVHPVKRWAVAEFAKHPGMLAAMKKDPEALSLTLSLDVAAPHIKAKGVVALMAGPIDLDGPLVLADRPADAPVIHLAGPLSVTLYASKPTLKRDRGLDITTAVGTPGLGAGTFAMVQYVDTIPESAHPKMAATFAPPKPGDPPVKKHYELKQRC